MPKQEDIDLSDSPEESWSDDGDDEGEYPVEGIVGEAIDCFGRSL